VRRIRVVAPKTILFFIPLLFFNELLPAISDI
jgi:hypothetical protein